MWGGGVRVRLRVFEVRWTFELFRFFDFRNRIVHMRIVDSEKHFSGQSDISGDDPEQYRREVSP